MAQLCSYSLLSTEDALSPFVGESTVCSMLLSIVMESWLVIISDRGADAET